jgi:uncharacterized repeat protein (TIGR03987 family)
MLSFGFFRIGKYSIQGESMPQILMLATTLILIALALYTFGIWGSKIAKMLKVWHAILMWIGLFFDCTGTVFMASQGGGYKLDLHGLTGAAAILAMLVNGIYATILLRRKRETELSGYRSLAWLHGVSGYYRWSQE